MNPKRVLWIAPCPPLINARTAGENTFNYYVRYIASDKRVEMKLLCLCDNDKRSKLEANKDLDITYIFNEDIPKYRKIVNLDCKYNPYNKYANLISNACANLICLECNKMKSSGYVPDVVILEWTACVVLVNRIKSIFAQARFVASEHDVVFTGMQRKKEYYQSLIWTIRAYNEKKIELRSLRVCDLIMVQNQDDRSLLSENGISIKVTKWLCPFFNDYSNLERSCINNEILFYGAMNRPENYQSAEWFIDKVMPFLSDMDVVFTVAGNKPPQSLINKANDKVKITGYVEKVDGLFEKSFCFVVPLLLGAGIKVKTLEALSSGIPVLANSIGIEGIKANSGVEYFHCEKPEEYASVIRSIFLGEIDTGSFYQNQKKMIKCNYDIIKSASNYLDLILSL